MKTIIKYTLITASRDWLFIGLGAVVFMAYCMSVFTGSTALVEESQMSLSYFAGSSRVVLTVGLIVFVCFHVRRSFENREVEAVLSKPVSRVQFVVAYWMGFSFLSFIATLPVLLIIVLLNKPDMLGLFYWGISLFFEISITVAFAMLSALIMKSAVGSVLSSFSFYLISRLMGFFIMAMDNPTSLMKDGKFSFIWEGMMKIISTIIPRFDLFAKSEWLIYGVQDQKDLWVFPVQFAAYISLLLAVSVFDFKRKQF